MKETIELISKLRAVFTDATEEEKNVFLRYMQDFPEILSLIASDIEGFQKEHSQREWERTVVSKITDGDIMRAIKKGRGSLSSASRFLKIPKKLLVQKIDKSKKLQAKLKEHNIGYR